MSLGFFHLLLIIFFSLLVVVNCKISGDDDESLLLSLKPEWKIVNTTTRPSKRHEACFVMVEGKGYLLGGRGKDKPVDVYDPSRQHWVRKTGPGRELHHMQCVAVQHKIWIVSSWEGRYPKERNVDKIYIYDTIQDEWATKDGLPEPRRRGGAAAVYYKGEIYVSHGNRGGHGPHSTTLAWMDKYNIQLDKWTTHLPDAPNPRDHTGGVVIIGDGGDNDDDNRMLCVAGGRDTGDVNWFEAVVLPTDCYSFETNTWQVKASIPQGRAGSNYGQTCDGKLMIAGGEGFGKAFDNVDVFDGDIWTKYPNLVIGRHGSGLAFSCECNQVHLASGSIKQGADETFTVETLFPFGRVTNCTTTAKTSMLTNPLVDQLSTEETVMIGGHIYLGTLVICITAFSLALAVWWKRPKLRFVLLRDCFKTCRRDKNAALCR